MKGIKVRDANLNDFDEILLLICYSANLQIYGLSQNLDHTKSIGQNLSIHPFLSSAYFSVSDIWKFTKQTHLPMLGNESNQSPLEYS